MASAFGVGLTIGMSQPLIALHLEGRGYSSLTIGIVAGAYSAAILLFGPFVPAIVARMGTVRTLALGSVLAAGALIAFPFAPGLPLIILLRFVMGLGNACDWIISETWINTLPDEASRGRVVAIYATIWGAGTTGGPAILWLTGTAGSLPFLVGAALLAVAFQPVLAARRLAPSIGRTTSSPHSVIRFLSASPLPIATGILCGFAEASVFSLFPIHATAHGMVAERAVLLASAFALGNFALQAPIGWLADRLSRRRLLGGIVIMALACLSIIPVGFGTAGLLWPTVILFGGAIAGLYTVGMVMLGQRHSAGDLAGASTAFILAYTVGMIVGPVASGAAMALWPEQGLLVALALVLAVFLVGILVFGAPSGPRGRSRGDSGSKRQRKTEEAPGHAMGR
ncbi:MFS transporter [Fodinicurvata sp. EGI_FJ10296]|uniref:MFS transporter n=1 Tax=Fodinicurvata sp. EGI_FJ10296 TaxID=3231908 RepID=UPI003453C5FA